MALFDKYEIVILDSSFFFRSFSEELREGLEHHKVYVSEYFNTELDQYLSLLTPDRKIVFNHNIDVIKNVVKPTRLNFYTIPSARYKHNDTWGLIEVLTQFSDQCVVLTGNKLLQNRVILNQVKIDIYDLLKFEFLSFTDYAKYKPDIAFHTEEKDKLIDIDESYIGNTRFYLQNETCIEVSDCINSGLEANLYQIKGQNSKIAKIFKRRKLSEQKFQNIQNLLGKNNELEVTWAMFPEQILYYDQECRIPAGFVESFAKTTFSLDTHPLYLGNIDLPKQYLNEKVSYSINLCIKIARQIKFLNTYGFIISDFTLGNFSFSEDHNAIQMWDTDSFGYQNYFSGYCDGNRLSREYDISKKEEALAFCEESLYVFAFEILSLGDTPISEYKGTYKFDNSDYKFIYRKKLIPSNLQNLFSKVFNRHMIPSVDALLYELSEALEDDFSSRTYGELLSDVLSKANMRKEKVEVKQASSIDSYNSSTRSTSTAAPRQTTSSQPPKQETKKLKSLNKLSSVILILILLIIAGIIGYNIYLQFWTLGDYLGYSIDDPEFEEALSEMDQKGIDYTLIGIPSSLENYGTIIDQTPGPESTKTEITIIYDTVSFYYNEGPAFIGMNREGAIDIIQDAGWTSEEGTDCPAGHIKAGTVCNATINPTDQSVQLEYTPYPWVDDTYLDSSYQIYMNTDDIEIKKGESTTLRISVNNNGNPNLNIYYFSYPEVSVDLEDWDGKDGVIKLTGDTAGKGYLKLILEDELGNTLAYQFIYMTVTE